MLSSAFSLNASPRQGSQFKSIGVSMDTKTIMGFREGLCRFDFRNDDDCFFVWIYEMEQFKLKIGRCFALISNQ